MARLIICLGLTKKVCDVALSTPDFLKRAFWQFAPNCIAPGVFSAGGYTRSADPTFRFISVFLLDTKICKNCDAILAELEHINDEAEKFGVAFVKNSDRPTAKKFGITKFPALAYFRNQEPTLYDGAYTHLPNYADYTRGQLFPACPRN